MENSDVYVIKPGCIEYIDLCAHSEVTKSDFFNRSSYKRLKWYGLILELEDVVKCLHNDDVEDDTESAGIVVPRSCIVSITYFKEEMKINIPILDQTEEVN